MYVCMCACVFVVFLPTCLALCCFLGTACVAVYCGLAYMLGSLLLLGTCLALCCFLVLWYCTFDERCCVTQ